MGKMFCHNARVRDGGDSFCGAGFVMPQRGGFPFFGKDPAARAAHSLPRETIADSPVPGLFRARNTPL